MLSYSAYDVVMELVGPIRSVGDSRVDADRLVNLNHLTEVVDRLLQEIADAAVAANRQEDSMKKIGLRAREYLQGLRGDGDNTP